ncbi:MAG: FixH family protein [Bacteroidota bacterium]
MDFGKGIIVAFISFAVFIGVLVVVCVRQDVNLVSANYYQEELAHSEKMDQIKNTNLLQERPQISLSENQIELHFSRFQEVEKGELTFMRPSDGRLDLHFKIESTHNNVQVFSLDGFAKGQYRAQFKWSMEGKDYFYEKIIVI